jgi:hypothetical protein
VRGGRQLLGKERVRGVVGARSGSIPVVPVARCCSWQQLCGRWVVVVVVVVVVGGGAGVRCWAGLVMVAGGAGRAHTHPLHSTRAGAGRGTLHPVCCSTSTGCMG